jgi:hypothetical protein
MADLSRPRILRCVRCGKRIRVSAQGRLPKYCGASCKSMSFTKRTRAMKKLPPASTDERQRRVLWNALRAFGLVTGEMPPRREAA